VSQAYWSGVMFFAFRLLDERPTVPIPNRLLSATCRFGCRSP